MKKDDRTVGVELDALDIEPLILSVIFEAGNLVAPVCCVWRVSHNVYTYLTYFSV